MRFAKSAFDYRSIPVWSALILFLIGFSVLLGWLLDHATLKSLLPGAVTMKANTALGFILCGGTLLALRHPGFPFAKVLQWFFPLLLGVMAVLILSQYLFGWDLGIDQLLFKDPNWGKGTSHPGRMAPNTAINFVLLATAFLLLGRNRPKDTGRALTLTFAVGLVTLLAFCGYLYQAQVFTTVASLTRMAVQTVFGMFVVCIGIMFLRPDTGFAKAILSSGTDGLIARRFLIPAVVAPLFIGWLSIKGQRLGYYDAAFQSALIIIADLLLFSLLSWSTLFRLRALEEEQKKNAIGGGCQSRTGTGGDGDGLRQK